MLARNAEPPCLNIHYLGFASNKNPKNKEISFLFSILKSAVMHYKKLNCIAILRKSLGEYLNFVLLEMLIFFFPLILFKVEALVVVNFYCKGANIRNEIEYRILTSKSLKIVTVNVKTPVSMGLICSVILSCARHI